MSMWVAVSWVFVLFLTGVNIFIFLKLKSASEQMLKMAFPGTKNMAEALGKMQNLMGPMPGMGGKPVIAANPEAQLKSAMEMLKQIQKKNRN